MPVNSLIPLSFRPTTDLMGPRDIISLQDFAQRARLREQEQQQKVKIQAALQEPGGLDQTGTPSLQSISKISALDPELGSRLSGLRDQATLRTFQNRQRKIEATLPFSVLRVSTYDKALREGKNPTVALQEANAAYMRAIDKGEADGSLAPILSPQEIVQGRSNGTSRPIELERALILQNGGKLPESAAPRTRTRIEGTQEVQEEFDQATQSWKRIGGGPRFKPNEAATRFEGKNGELMAALAERGVSLPAGFRSAAQQAGLLDSLWKRNPELSADQIADKVKSGQIDLANVRKAGQVAAGIAGKVAYAENEIKQTIPLVREASANLPRGQFIPFNKLRQMSQEKFSDPNLAEFRMYMTSLSNAYDMLAARGGTDVEKRAENRKNFDMAQSPEALERVLQAVMKEAQASGRAAKAAMTPPGEKEVERATSKSGRPMHKNAEGKWEYD